VQHRHLGNSGLLVSAITYGNWITHGSQVEQDAAIACVQAALDSGITSFDTTLTKTAQFSGQVFLIPGDAVWNGLLTGAFSKTGDVASIEGKYVRGDGHCDYDVVGNIVKSVDAGVIAISLEDIEGVDGCQRVVSTSHAKAGHASFKVTNNTLGFAQVFIYDAEHNLAGYNKKDIPKRGGSVKFTADLVAGTYDVVCDGPGSEDKTIQLQVE